MSSPLWTIWVENKCKINIAVETPISYLPTTIYWSLRTSEMWFYTPQFILFGNITRNTTNEFVCLYYYVVMDLGVGLSRTNSTSRIIDF